MKYLLCLIFLCGLSTNVSAQLSHLSAVQSLKKLTLEYKQNENVDIYYGEKNTRYLPLASEIVSDSIQFYESIFQQQLSLSLALLNEQDFADYKSLSGDQAPYGMPYVRPDDVTKNHYVISLPATERGVISQSVLGLRASISDRLLKAFTKSGYSVEEAAAIFPYIIGAHEVSHVYVRHYGIQPTTSWMNEFLAQLGAYVYLVERRPKLARLFELTSYQINADTYHPKDSSLERFELLYSDVGAKDYSWYQGMFLQLGIKAYRQHGIGVFKILKKQFSVKLVEDNAHISERLSIGDQKLKKIIIDYADWRSQFSNHNQ